MSPLAAPRRPADRSLVRATIARSPRSIAVITVIAVSAVSVIGHGRAVPLAPAPVETIRERPCVAPPLSGAESVPATARLSRIDFPRVAPSPGTPVPNRDGARQLKDFDGLDYDGYGKGPNRRLAWVPDPLAQQRAVLRFTVRDGDIASHWGGPRTELFRRSADHTTGKEAWFTWSWLLGDGIVGARFRRPSTRGLGFQLWNGGPPPISIDFSRGRQALQIRQSPHLNAAENIVLGGYARGRRHYFLMYVRLSHTRTGEVRLWHRLDSPPCGSATPTVVRRGIRTRYASRPGYPKIGLYRPDNVGDRETFPWTYYLYGYRRASSKAGALSMWYGSGADVRDDV